MYYAKEEKIMGNFYAFPGIWLKAVEDIKPIGNTGEVIKAGTEVQLLSVSKGFLAVCAFTFVGIRGLYDSSGKGWDRV